MAKSSTSKVKGNKSKGGRKPGSKNKQTIMKEEAMKRVLEQQAREELGIEVSTATVLDYAKRENIIKMLYAKGSGLIDKDENFRGRKVDVKALLALYDRLESKKQFVQTEAVNPLPNKIEITVKKVGDYDRDKDPEVTNYGKTKSATESNTG